MTTKAQHRENARVIRDTRQILVDEGWTTGRMGLKGDEHCVLGAFRLACHLRQRTEETVYANCPPAQAFGDCLREDGVAHHDGHYGIVHWNDLVAKSVEVVLRALDKCAESEEAKAS